jgi:hypothetical protein
MLGISGCFAMTGGCGSQCGGTQSSSTPLVLDFNDAPVQFQQGGGEFDLGAGPDVATDWPTAATPWLAMDRNGNGKIDDGSELFGSDTRLASGEEAANGFEALRELDSDGDGRITPADRAWPKLLVWSDRNGDRVSSPDELAPLSRFGITWIGLDYVSEWTCNDRGDCEGQRAPFAFVVRGEAREGKVIDLYLGDQSD